MENSKAVVSTAERATVARAVCKWLSGCEYIPASRVEFEFLGETGVTVSVIQAAYKNREYIDGSYQAVFSFYVIYRDRPSTADNRLSMDETLNGVAEWCESSCPELDGNMTAQRVECSNSPAMSARYDDGTEDHQISLNLYYEVITNG